MSKDQPQSNKPNQLEKRDMSGQTTERSQGGTETSKNVQKANEAISKLKGKENV